MVPSWLGLRSYSGLCRQQYNTQKYLQTATYNMEEYLQFDRYFASLVERQYEHVVGQSTALAYSHAGDLWEEKMNTIPDKPVVIKHRKVDDSSDDGSTSTQLRKSPDIPKGRAHLRATYGLDTDGLLCTLLEGPVMTDNIIAKPLFSGVLTMDTLVTINENTGAPLEFLYTMTNTTTRDVEIILDLAECRGVMAVTTDTKIERDRRTTLQIKAKETLSVACLKPQKKKSLFAWEDNSDEDEEEEDGGSRRKKKSKIHIRGELTLRWLWSREVSFQMLTKNCSAVYNARGETDYEKYFYGRSNENVFEWIEKQEAAAVVDRIAPPLALGRMMAYLRADAREYASRVLEGYTHVGEISSRVIVNGLKASLKQTYGAHNQSLLTAVDAGMSMQIKELLRGDVTTYGPDHLHVSSQRRLDYHNIEPYGPRPKDAPTELFGRDPRSYPQYPAGWPRTLPFVSRMPIYGRMFQSHLSGATALHLASANKDLPVVKTLVHYGWKLHVCDYQGRTPVEVADLRGHVALHQYLFHQHWRRPVPSEHSISSVISMLRECQSECHNVRVAMVATQEVSTSMDNQGILGMNQLIEFRDATAQTLKEAQEHTNKAILLAEAVNGKGALEDESEDESEEESEEEEGVEEEKDEKEVEEEEEVTHKDEDNKGKAATEENEKEASKKITTKITIDADNYDMLNLWHVLYVGDAENAAAAIRRGCKLQYMTNVGWQALSSSEIFVNYSIHDKRWTDGGGTSLAHAIVCQEYEFPAPKAKPCLLLLLDEGYPGDGVDMYGRTAADYAKKYDHSAMSGVLKALVRKPSASASKRLDNETDSDDSDGSDDYSRENKDQEEKKQIFPEQWIYTRPATCSENQILLGVCSGVHGNTADNVVREAVLGGKSLFTHGTGKVPMVGCRKRNNEQYPVRYDVNWTTRFEPTVEAGRAEVDGLGWNALHVAAFAGEVEIVALLLAAGWNPTATTGRGFTSIDLARIMEHDALHYALEQVVAGEYDVMVRGTTMYYAALRSFACPKLIEYAQESQNMVEIAKREASKVNTKYEEMKAEEDRIKAELEAAENSGKKQKRLKKKRKKKIKSPKIKDKKKHIVSVEESSRKEKEMQQKDVVRKTFFRGRLRFRANPVTKNMLSTWACFCTTINPLCATTCKFCYVGRTEQETKAKANADYAAQFNHKESKERMVESSWGKYAPITMTLEEEKMEIIIAREKILRLIAKKSLYNKMRGVIKSSLKKFAHMPKVSVDALLLAHMFDIVHNQNSSMEMVEKINVWLGNEEKVMQLAKEMTDQTGGKGGGSAEDLINVQDVNEELMTKIHVHALAAKTENVTKNEVTEWLGDPEWRPQGEEQDETKTDAKADADATVDGEEEEKKEGKEEKGRETGK